MVQCVADAGIGWDLILIFPPIFDEGDIRRAAGRNDLIGYIELGISQKFLSHNGWLLAISNWLFAFLIFANYF